MIKAKGSNVAPAEVEKAIASHDGVKAAFVFGVDHPDRGQDVVALVVGDRPADELHAALRDQLSSYKLPRHIFGIEATDVPSLSSQNPDRRTLADLAARLTAAATAG